MHVFSLGVPPPAKCRPPPMFPKPQETETLTWELIAVTGSKSGVATAIGCHKVGVALNREKEHSSVRTGASGLGGNPREWR